MQMMATELTPCSHRANRHHAGNAMLSAYFGQQAPSGRTPDNNETMETSPSRSQTRCLLTVCCASPKGGTRSWVLIYRQRTVSRRRGRNALRFKAARDQAFRCRSASDQHRMTRYAGEQRADGKLMICARRREAAKYATQWLLNLPQPLYALRIDQIDTPAILKVLKPIWTRVPETASRVRGRIEAILDYAKADDETRQTRAGGGIVKTALDQASG